MPNAPAGIRRVLSIAGSDSSGGAGLQADAGAFARLGVHGSYAVAALTAQNTIGVHAVHNVPPDFVAAQIGAILSDIGADAVKVGMLGTRENVETVADCLRRLPPGVPVVIDPVLTATAGGVLLSRDAVAAMREMLAPLATVLTPNLDEARVLGGSHAEDPAELARAVHQLGSEWTLITGGHGAGLVDVLFDGERMLRIEGRREAASATHGSGCTHSAALAALLALGHGVPDAARRAQALTGEAIRSGLEQIGAGAGPVRLLPRS